MTRKWLERLKNPEPEKPDINKPVPIGSIMAPLPKKSEKEMAPWKRMSIHETGKRIFRRKLDPYNRSPKVI